MAQANIFIYGMNRTKEVAEMKDWRCRSKRSRAMREIARQWIPGGVAFMSPDSMVKLYGDLVPACWEDDLIPCYWCIEKESNSNKINFIKLF